MCVCVPCLGGSGRPAFRTPSGAQHLSFGRSCRALCLFGPLWLGLPRLWLLLGFFLFVVSHFSSPVEPPLPPALRVFRHGVPWALASSCPPPPPPVFLCTPVVSGVLCFLARGALSLSALVFPLPPPFFVFFSFVSWFFLFFSFLFLPVVRCGAFLCVLGRRVCPSVPRWCCPCHCSLRAGWCCFVLPVGPGCPLLSPGGSWCCVSVVLSLSGCVACPPVVWRGVYWCSAALCCVLLRCAVVCWCAVVLCRSFA